MKIAVFSDVHGNLCALQSVMRDIDQHGKLDAVVFAGDLCFFGPRPEACVRLLQESQILSIAGNTEHWIFEPPPITDNTPAELKKKRNHIRAFSSWTKEQLSDDSLEWLGTLRDSFQLQFSPTDNVEEDLLVFHANPQDVNQLIFPAESDQQRLYGNIRQTDEETIPLLAGIESNFIAFGHLHIPSDRQIQGKNLFNISSVSIPGNGDPRAKYAIFSWTADSGWQLERRYLDFDTEPEIKAFREHRPPGWEKYMKNLVENGFVPQVV